MKKFLSAIFMLISPAVFAVDVDVLVTNGTSRTDDSSITCLFVDGCDGKWRPASKDEGVDEGIYIQFKEPVMLYSVEMDASKNLQERFPYFQIYLNGKTTSPDDVVYISSSKHFPDTNKVVYTFKGRDQENYQGSLYTLVKSIFIKIGRIYGDDPVRPTITAMRFYRRVPTDKPENVELERVKVNVPKFISTRVSATSVLQPETAYSPANLFDSKYDFAWSTNGKVTNGIGESLTLEFPEPQSISGFYLWNGYQRSTVHFESNGKVKTILVTTDKGDRQQVKLSAKNGMQKIMLSKMLQRVNQVSLKILDVYSGTRYRDVLLSEMRILDQNGKILLPVVKKEKLVIPKRLQGFIDRSWSSFLHGITDERNECTQGCFNKRIRLRSNGSFVIYRDFSDYANGDRSLSANVLEGNWVIENDKLRIFGKRYTTELRSSDYMQGRDTDAVPKARIFQSYLMIKPYSELTYKQKDDVVQFLLKSRGMPKSDSKQFVWVNYYNTYKEDAITGNNLDAMIVSLKRFLDKTNPYYIKSSVFTDLVLPTTRVAACDGFC